MLKRSVVLLAALSSASVLAHKGCGGGEVMRRNPGGRIVGRRSQAAPTDEASGATSTDITYECTGYSYDPLDSLKSTYPAVWTTASILSGDTAAQTLFASINATLNSKVGTDTPHCSADDCHAGDFTGVAYNGTDPDCWWTWQGCTTPAANTGLSADITTVPEPQTWGYGFDDGPNCSHNAFYDYLAENNQKATMFFIGSNVYDWPLQALRATADGHQICVHTWSHQYMTSFTNDVAFAELYYARKIIKDILGVTPKCWRPPFGDVDNRIRTIAAGMNMTTVVWSDDSEDWRANVTAGVTAANVTQNYQTIVNRSLSGGYATHGPVVLTHELTNFTMSEAISQYPSIKAAFKHIVPMCVAYNITYPYEETNITCPTFESYIAGNVNISASTTNSNATTSSSQSASTSMTSGSASSSVSASGTSSLSASASSASASIAKNISAGERSTELSGVILACVVLCASLIFGATASLL